MLQNLKRLDYIQTGLLTPQSIQLFPPRGPGAHQRIAVGDKDGRWQILSVRQGQAAAEFQSPAGPPIECLQVVSPLDNMPEKLLVAFGQSIKGYTKKGKQLFSLETNMSEPIKHMIVVGPNILVCSRMCYNLYVDGKDTHYITLPDGIQTLALLPTEKVGLLTPILGCRDGCIYVLRDAQIRHRIPLGNGLIPTALCLWDGDGGPSGEDVLVGTEDGHVVLLTIARSGGFVQQTYSPPDGCTGGVTCLTCVRGLCEGLENQIILVVGKDDGFVLFYDVTETKEPAPLLHTINVGESIVSVLSGYIGTPGFVEVLVATYKGNIVGFTNHVPAAPPVTAQRAISSNRAQIHALHREIELINQQLELARMKQQETQTLHPPSIPLLDKWMLMPSNGGHALKLECPLAFDVVMLYCNLDATIRDVEKNAAVLTLQPEDNGAMAMYRCQSNTTSLDIQVSWAEGKPSGNLVVYIVPHITPKCTLVRNYAMKPMHCHKRIEAPVPSLALPLSVEVRGNFIAEDIHTWVGACMEDWPMLMPEDSNDLWFKSFLTNTYLRVKFSRGHAEFTADNLVPLAVLQEAVSDAATSRSILLDMNVELGEKGWLPTLRHFLGVISSERERIRLRQMDTILAELILNESDSTVQSQLRDLWPGSHSETSQTSDVQVFKENVICLLQAQAQLDGRTVSQPSLTKLRNLLDEDHPRWASDVIAFFHELCA